MNIRERRQRRDSVSRSDTSGSSAGDLGDITPCNASPHILSFRVPIRDEAEEQWRRNMKILIENQPVSHAPDLLLQLYRLIKELTVKTIGISKDAIKFFTGVGLQLGQRISVLADLLSSREDPPRVWYNQNILTKPKLLEKLRFSILEVQEHLETYFDRKDNSLECLEAMKATYKLTLFSDTESALEGSSNMALASPDPTTNELLIDTGRGIYKLLFQLLLLIESDHKISSSVVQNLFTDRMEDCSEAYANVKGALLRCIDDADLNCLDTSTSTEGEHTPTPSPGPQPSSQEFESTLYDMIDAQKWSSAIAYVRQYRKYSSAITLSPSGCNYMLQPSASIASCSSLTYGGSPECNWMMDDVSLILNIYAQNLIKDKSRK